MALQLQQVHSLCTRNHKPGKVGEGLVFGHFLQTTPCTLDLLHSDLSSSPVELDGSSPIPLGCQKVLDLKSGRIFYKGKRKHEESNATMSRNGKAPKLDLRLNLSPPRANPEDESPPRRSGTPPSPLSSCISTENAESNSPEATSMVLVGCPRCMMYVMLSEEDPKCPKCKSPVLLDFLHENNNTKTKKN